MAFWDTLASIGSGVAMMTPIGWAANLLSGGALTNQTAKLLPKQGQQIVNTANNAVQTGLNAIGSITPAGMIGNGVSAILGGGTTTEKAVEKGIDTVKGVGEIVEEKIDKAIQKANDTPKAEIITPTQGNTTPITENTTPKPEENQESDLKKSPLITESGNLENKQEETIENQESKDFDITKYYEDWQKKIWEREDTIRKETQEREDSAFQRAVNDMRKSGINPNLVGINPANSGGGIVTAGNVMGNKTSAQSTEVDKMKTLLNDELQKYITDANNLVKSGVATEQNLTAILNGIISTAGRLGGLMLLG